MLKFLKSDVIYGNQDTFFRVIKSHKSGLHIVNLKTMAYKEITNSILSDFPKYVSSWGEKEEKVTFYYYPTKHDQSMVIDMLNSNDIEARKYIVALLEQEIEDGT